VYPDIQDIPSDVLSSCFSLYSPPFRGSQIGNSSDDLPMPNFLHGTVGDRINALLAGCGFNLRKLFRFFLSHPLIEPSAIA
jgi:hypothetical protein